jgi:hypothetical protein
MRGAEIKGLEGYMIPNATTPGRAIGVTALGTGQVLSVIRMAINVLSLAIG